MIQSQSPSNYGTRMFPQARKSGWGHSQPTQLIRARDHRSHRGMVYFFHRRNVVFKETLEVRLLNVKQAGAPLPSLFFTRFVSQVRTLSGRLSVTPGAYISICFSCFRG